MTREPYWGLFWATGMPEAWLMGRSEPLDGLEGDGSGEAAGLLLGTKPATLEGKTDGQ